MRDEMHALHAEHEATHWWYAARRQIVLDLLRRGLGTPDGTLRLLDIGCGAGGLLPYLAQFGAVTGVDPSPGAVAHAARHGAGDVHVGTLPDGLPFGPQDRFDVITLLDVVEHVAEDVQSLSVVNDLLEPDGTLVITVPAFPFLWSGHDVVNEHKRRYTRATLRDRLERAGFQVTLLSYYNAALFPPIAALRMTRRLVRGTEARADVGAVPAPVNAVLRTVFAAERHVLGRLPLPFGLSLIATARPQHRPGAS
jgi:SAM-dependent methyltransferase